MWFLLLSNQANLQFPDLDAAVWTIEMRVHPGTGLQFQHVFLFVQRPDSSEGRVEVPNDRLCGSVQNLSRVGWPGKSGAHISANTRLTCLRGSNFLRLLPVLDVGTRSIPFDDVSFLVAQRHGAEQEPARFPVSPPQACFSLQRFPGRQGRAPLVHEPCTVFRMNRGLPALAQSVLQRETRIFQPTLIEEI